MWMSIPPGARGHFRSNIGPEMRFWYLATAEWAQVQGFCKSPYPQPHGQGYTIERDFLV